jgi:hypothetical protein
VRGGYGHEACGQCLDPITVAHPDIEHLGPIGITPIEYALEQAAGTAHPNLGIAKFPRVPGYNLPSQLRRHGLHAITNAEHWHTELEDTRWRSGRRGFCNRLGTPGEDHAVRAPAAHRRLLHVPGVNLAIHAELAHATGDQLRVLGAKIQDQDAVGVNIRRQLKRAGPDAELRRCGNWAPPW